MKINVLIGRFQPLHAGHEALIKYAIKGVDKLLILVGSANKPRSVKNPWTFAERKGMIESYLDVAFSKGELTFDEKRKVEVVPINDFKYSDHAWVAEVIEAVRHHSGTIAKIQLVGHWKRGNTYLRYFPQWPYKEFHSNMEINATDLRREMMDTNHHGIPKSVMSDYTYFSAESMKFKNYPYPETLSFQCADSIVTCAGHVLLIQRKFAPGAGNWAFPGGFKNGNEPFLECAIRELYEETNLRVPEKILSSSLVHARMFDAPDRASGIPRVTMAHHFNIEPDADGNLPRANGHDDAMECKWISIGAALNDIPLHDDHGDILQTMTSSSVIPAYMNPRIILKTNRN